jgi:hypothetical protein
MSAIGVLFSIGIDQVAMHYMQDKGATISLQRSVEANDDDDSDSDIGANEHAPLTQFEVDSSHHYLSSSTNNSASRSTVIAKLYILEAAIAVHSVIIGFGFGVLDPVETLKKAAALITAFSFHQFFEGIGLSTTIMSMLKHQQDRSITVSFGLIFSLTFPFGAIIGIYNVSDTYESLLLQGFANAFAGGILLYTSLVEMISVDFSNSLLINRPILKGFMFMWLVFGFSFMAALAVIE